MSISKVAGCLMIAGAMLLSIPAQAADFIFTSPTNSSTSGSTATSKVVTVGGITVTATAWSTDQSGVSFLPEAAFLGRYTSGVGVTNSNEGNGQQDNSHVIDNIGSFDFIRLVFSTSVRLTGLVLTPFDVNPFGGSDSDAWVSFGSTGFGTTASWQGYLDRGVGASSGFSSTNDGTTWLVGAARGAGDRDDGFKLKSVSAVSAVPEPATWAMMLLGFGVIGGTMRRRSSHKSVLSRARRSSFGKA